MTDQPPGSLASLLRRARRQLSLEQRQLAGRVDFSTRTVSRWETGRAVPPLAVRPRLLQVLSGASPELVGLIARALGLPPPAGTVPSQPKATPEVTPAATVPSQPAPAATVPSQPPPIAKADEARPPAEPPAPDPEVLRAALEDLLHAGAEELDVSPRRLRAVLLDLLRELALHSADVGAGRAALAPRRELRRQRRT
ncbi:MAG: helix-turn-helix domain-containing protein [Planctomycetes bacterium]|nr:helix-turn-helix domain-containing protein [Planctomycetota bacterium]